MPRDRHAPARCPKRRRRGGVRSERPRHPVPAPSARRNRRSPDQGCLHDTRLRRSRWLRYPSLFILHTESYPGTNLPVMQPRPTDLSRDRRRAWIWIGLGVLAVALCIGWLALPVGEWVASFQRRILGLGVWGVAIFAAVFIVATLILAPDWPLAVAA